MKQVKLQAHRGVASDCPENTMSAFYCAVLQGYDVIELDLGYTKDGQIVVLHDNTINRTARNADGSKLTGALKIEDMTYEEALFYDFGIGQSLRFRGEKLPLFADVLEFAKKERIQLKIDSKIQNFPKEMLEKFLEEIEPYQEWISLTSNDVERIDQYLALYPDIHVDYDGQINEKTLKTLSEKTKKGQLRVWVPYRCQETLWVSEACPQVGYADEALCRLVKQYAELGIWLICRETDYEDVVKRFAPDIVETDGHIKPIREAGVRYDIHTHSRNSHDSQCLVEDMAAAAKKNGLAGFAVTDHCDIEFSRQGSCDQVVAGSLDDVKKAVPETNVLVLRGVEMGEAFWHPQDAERILDAYRFDVVIGSVHAVKFPEYEMPYSQIDFGKMDEAMLKAYLMQYFQDMIRMIDSCSFDVLAHLTCPLRYINGKYGRNVDIHGYRDAIELILKKLIEKKIALEVNTSCVYPESRYCEFMPESWILKRYRELGGYLITLGSDAHAAEKSALSFDLAYRLIREIGFDAIYYYKDRLPVHCMVIR